jgi:hypothetical protein
MRRFRVFLAVVLTVAGSALVGQATPTSAAANSWGSSAVNGFSTPSGKGFWLLRANGTVSVYGNARWYGDASGVSLNGPIVGGAVTPTGKGYWLVAQDGGIFTFGDAKFYGSMGNQHLNQPVFSMAPTKAGHGYWLVARDGGIFTFGDAKFYGSTGSLVLRQPISGITTTPSGKGYRLAAKDGGIFNFGDAQYYGSLPGRGVSVSDVAGMAPTPSSTGYWMARSRGAIYAFGNAYKYVPRPISACDPVVAIFSNPKTQGFRLVTLSGATLPFGGAPGGTKPTGRQVQCPPSNPPTISLAEFLNIQGGMTYDQVASLVGGPGTLVSASRVLGIEYTVYRWPGEGAPGAYALVYFRNNGVYLTAGYGLE